MAHGSGAASAEEALKFIFKDDTVTVVCIDLDSTLIVDGRLNIELIAFLKKMKIDADAQGHPIHFYIFTARNRVETFRHLFIDYCYFLNDEVYSKKTADDAALHEAALKRLVTIQDVLNALEASGIRGVCVADTYDKPGEIGSYFPVLQRVERQLIDYVNKHSLKLRAAKGTEEYEEVEAAFTGILGRLEADLLDDQRNAGPRCRSKAAMLLDIETAVKGKYPGGKRTSYLWVDDLERGIRDTLSHLLERMRRDLIATLLIAHINHSIPNPSAFATLYSALYSQIHQRRLGRAAAGQTIITGEIHDLLMSVEGLGSSFELLETEVVVLAPRVAFYGTAVPADATHGEEASEYAGDEADTPITLAVTSGSGASPVVVHGGHHVSLPAAAAATAAKITLTTRRAVATSGDGPVGLLPPLSSVPVTRARAAPAAAVGASAALATVASAVPPMSASAAVLVAASRRLPGLWGGGASSPLPHAAAAVPPPLRPAAGAGVFHNPLRPSLPPVRPGAASGGGGGSPTAGGAGAPPR